MEQEILESWASNLALKFIEAPMTVGDLKNLVIFIDKHCLPDDLVINRPLLASPTTPEEAVDPPKRRQRKPGVMAKKTAELAEAIIRVLDLAGGVKHGEEVKTEVQEIVGYEVYPSLWHRARQAAGVTADRGPTAQWYLQKASNQ